MHGWPGVPRELLEYRGVDLESLDELLSSLDLVEQGAAEEDEHDAIPLLVRALINRRTCAY